MPAARPRSASGPRTCTSPARPIPPDLCFDAVVEVVEQLGSEILLDMRVGDAMMVASVEPTREGEGARHACGSRCAPPGCTYSTRKTEAAI